jgi:CBS domain-containing protein
VGTRLSNQGATEDGHMKVRQLMSDGIVTIEETANCHEAVQKMVRHRVRHLPVVTRHGTLCGIVTDRDLRQYLFEPETFRQIGSVSLETLMKSMPVSRVMSAPVTTVDADDPLEQAARVMLEAKLGSLPVMDSGRLCGIVTETDLLRRIVGDDACCADVGEIVVSFP